MNNVYKYIRKLYFILKFGIYIFNGVNLLNSDIIIFDLLNR